MYDLGFENNPLGAENCMSSKSENLKLLDSFHMLRCFVFLKASLNKSDGMTA